MDLFRKLLGIKPWRMTQIKKRRRRGEEEESLTNSPAGEVEHLKTRTAGAENGLFSKVTRDRESVSGAVQMEFQAASDWSALAVLPFFFFFFSVSKRFVVESDRRVKRLRGGFMYLISAVASMSSH